MVVVVVVVDVVAVVHMHLSIFTLVPPAWAAASTLLSAIPLNSNTLELHSDPSPPLHIFVQRALPYLAAFVRPGIT